MCIPEMDVSINDFVINVATANGTGSQSSNLILLNALFEMGVPVIHAAQHFDTRVFDSHGIEIARATKSGAQNIDVTIPLL